MHFGVYSLLLTVGAANGVFLAALLLIGAGKHRGSAWLAALAAGLSLRLLPYILGFAGAYDLHPALTFAPFDSTLAWGPLLWGYVHVLSTGQAPSRWRPHVAPFVLQLLYRLLAFALPLPEKWAWYTGTHLTLVEPVGAVLVLLSFAAYGYLSWRQYERWQGWLDANLSNREDSRLTWLRVLLCAFGVTGAIGAVLALVHLLVTPLDYFARLPVVGALPVLAYVIALLGYRFGGHTTPMDASVAAAVPAAVAVETLAAPAGDPLPVNETPRSTKDYAAEAAEWRLRVVAQGWHRDPQLTATKLAGLLGCSPRSLSRTLNERLGESFNAFVNRIRVEEAIAILATPNAPDVLRVAFDVGFASKASFNRAFQRHAGATPTAVRNGRVLRTSQIPPV